MDDQVQLLTSIRDILTRIERVLERIEGQGVPAAGEAPLAASVETQSPSAEPAKSAAATPATFGRAKWNKR